MLNENGARDRARLIAVAPEMLKFIADFKSTMENMTTADFETGKNKDLRDRASKILQEVNKK